LNFMPHAHVHLNLFDFPWYFYVWVTGMWAISTFAIYYAVMYH